jgi:DNA-binding MarR family transcriptional regulator
MAKSKPHRSAAALDRSPSHLLHRAVQLALDVYAEELGAGAVTQRQFAVLAAAAEHDGATQTELVKLTGIDRSTMAEMAARLISTGLLERRRSTSDARANAVSLTEAGRAVLEETAPKVAAADGRLLKLISGGGRRQAFVTLLQDLLEGAERQAHKRDKAAAKARKSARVVSVEEVLAKKKKKPKKVAA